MKLDIGERESASKAARPRLQEWSKVEVELEAFGQQAALRGPLREGFVAGTYTFCFMRVPHAWT